MDTGTGMMYSAGNDKNIGVTQTKDEGTALQSHKQSWKKNKIKYGRIIMLKYQKKGLCKALSMLLAVVMLLTAPLGTTQAYAQEDGQLAVTDSQGEVSLGTSDGTHTSGVLNSGTPSETPAPRTESNAPEEPTPSDVEETGLEHNSAAPSDASAMQSRAALYRSPDIFVVKTVDELSVVLNNLVDGDVIRLSDNINYTTNYMAVSIQKKVTFDLGIYTLNITSAQHNGTGLVVGSGGEVSLQNSTGELNVSGGSYGLQVIGGPEFAQAMVTNATARNAGGAGISAVGDANAVALGNVSSYGAGAHASGIESTVLVHGKISARTFGAHSQSGGKITAKQGVTQVGEDGTGAYISGSEAGSIMIGGDIHAKDYIRFDDTFIAKGDGVADPTEPGYTKYTNGARVVWVKGVIVSDDNVCEIDGKQYGTLDLALAEAATGKTIKLLDNIVYEKSISGDGAIVVSGKTFTFDLSGYDLTIRNPEGTGLLMKDNANVAVTGTGNLNIDSQFAALSTSEATFTAGSSANVNLKSSHYMGIYALTSMIDIQQGSITGAGGGVYTAGSDTSVTFNGPITTKGLEGWYAHGVHLNGVNNIVDVSGDINVTTGLGSGICVVDGGTVTVGSQLAPASVTGIDNGIWTRQGSKLADITVYGDVTGGINSIHATGDADITVVGNVKSTSESKNEAYAVYGLANSTDNISIDITGNVEGPGGVNLNGNSNTVTITGNVTATSTVGETAGVYASNGTVMVTGNVTAPNCIGAVASKNGQITIDGVLTGNSYVRVYYVTKTADEKTLPTTKMGYHTYSNQSENAIVWIKDATSSSSVCAIGDTQYATLTDALAAVKSTETIKLLKDINYDEGIVIDGKTVTFDVGSFTLSVTNTTSSHGIGLTVTNSGHVNLVGSGEFNITHISNSGESIGLLVHGGSSATVTNVKAVAGVGSGVYANGDGAVIHVLGNVETTGSSAYGAKTWNDGLITIDGMLMTASRYIDIGGEYKAKTEGVEDPSKTGYLKYSGSKTTGIVWIKDTAPPATYTLIVQGGTGGSNYTKDSTVSIIANSPPAGQRFKEWEISPAVTFTGGTSKIDATAKFIMPAQTVTATATYEDLPVSNYTITVQTDGHGTANANVNSAAQGEEIILTASENDGYRFKEWQVISGGVTITANKFDMPSGNVTIKAIFEEASIPTYTVTVISGSGDGTGATGAGSYSKDTTVDIYAGNRSGYSFTGWTSSDVTITNAGNKNASFTMPTKNVTVTANWKYNGGGNSGGNSGGSSSGGSDSGSTMVITTTPEKKPNQPVSATAPVTATAGKNSSASAAIPEKAVAAAIAKAQAEAKAQGKNENGISVGVNITMPKEATTLTAILTRNALNSLVNTGVISLSINGSDVTVTFDKKALAEIQKQSSGNISITIAMKTNLTAGAKKIIGTRPMYDITVGFTKGGKNAEVSSFGGGTVTVSIPYTLRKNEVAGGLYAVYVDAKGNATRIASSAYDANSGCVIFTTTHFSLYGVGYTAPSARFNDISTHWGKENIDYVVGRGILSGTSDNTFAPNNAMTQGILVTALGRLAGVDVSDYKTVSFTDVAADKYYAPYIEWAYKNGIVSGIGNSQFAPDRAITREEIALILDNYAKATGYTLPVTREASAFADDSGIGSTYKDAVKAMQQAGIMMGGDGNKFNPEVSATRAEVSAMLHRYIKLTIDPATAQGWAVNDAGQRLYYKDGKALTGWQNIGSGDSKKRYYFTKDTVMVSAKWLVIDKKWYYFNTDGSLAVSTKVDGYEVDENGVRKTKS